LLQSRHPYGGSTISGGARQRRRNRNPIEARVDAGELSMTALIKFMRDESGATAIEYGLIAAGISVAIIAVVQGLGSKLNTTFTSVQTALK
jgi:pilus assembly protein Flp/PilA